MIEFTRPRYGGSIMVSYEGPSVGPIYISDILDDDIRNAPTLTKGKFMIVNYIDVVHESVTNGILKYFSDIVKWKANPPIVLYRLRHFI